MNGTMLLSIIVPVYKEEKNVPEFLRRLQPILAPITADYEIIFRWIRRPIAPKTSFWNTAPKTSA